MVISSSENQYQCFNCGVQHTGKSNEPCKECGSTEVHRIVSMNEHLNSIHGS